jgi:hypothetical protein
MKWLLLTCASSLALFAQKLEVSSKAAAPGDRTSVVISVVLPKGSDVVGIQWETTFSPQQMSIEGSGPEASDAAKAAGKSLTCAKKVVKDLDAYRCILIGGQKLIEGGPIAVFNFRISPKPQSRNIRVRVGHAEAVTKDLRKLSLTEAEGTISVK